jgi:acyl carrier protein
MIVESASPVLETVAVWIHGAGRLGDIPVHAGDNLTDLGLSRLRLLGVLIELEAKYDIEFPDEAIDNFLVVSDIALYIQSRQMMPYDDEATERTAVTTSPIDRRRSARDRARRVCARVFGSTLGLARLVTDGSRPHSFRRPNQKLALQGPVAHPASAWERKASGPKRTMNGACGEGLQARLRERERGQSATTG